LHVRATAGRSRAGEEGAGSGPTRDHVPGPVVPDGGPVLRDAVLDHGVDELVTDAVAATSGVEQLGEQRPVVQERLPLRLGGAVARTGRLDVQAVGDTVVVRQL